MIEQTKPAEPPFRTAALLAMLAVLMLLLLWPSTWNSNEEDYFQLAYRAVAPGQFGPFHAAYDSSRARFVSEHLIGWLVAGVGYERAHAIGRIGMALAYAASLSYFLRRLRFGWLDAALVIVVFQALGQQLIGGEWLFEGVEPKTLAYAALFVAFGLAARGRWLAATVAGIAAAYLHFLIGGFWTCLLLATQWLTADGPRRTRAVAMNAALLALAALPLVALIVHDQWGQPVTAEAAARANDIYANIRNPHHIAPFAGPHTFWTWTTGTVADLSLAVCLAVSLRRRGRTSMNSPHVAALQAAAGAVDRFGRPTATDITTVAALLGAVYLLAALVLAYADRHSLHFSKLYLFRPSALALLLGIVALWAWARDALVAEARQVVACIGLAVVVPFVFGLAKQRIDEIRRPVLLPHREALIAAVTQRTEPGAIVLIEPGGEYDAPVVSLHRLLPRPTLVSWKFVPTNPAEILRWYGDVQMRADLYDHGCTQTQPLRVPIGYLVTLHADTLGRVADCGPVVWQEGDLALVKVVPGAVH